MTQKVLDRMKANFFFFAGSCLYLPVTVWDVVAMRRESVEDPNDNLIHVLILLSATICYLCNGLIETHTAYGAYQKSLLSSPSQDQRIIPRKLDIANGLLFTTAATLELTYALTGRKLVFSSISSHVYVANALLTLYLRRNADMSSRPARMVRAGDVLFLLGASLDTTGSYLEMAGKLTNPAALWLTSSLSWLTDAILYLIADKISLEEHYETSNYQGGSLVSPNNKTASSQPTMAESEMSETASVEPPKRLSDIV